MSTPIDGDPAGTSPDEGSGPDQPALEPPVTGLDYGTPVTAAPAATAAAAPAAGERRSPGMLITALVGLVSLLAGIVIGMLIPRGASNTTATPTGTAVTAQQQAPASPDAGAQPTAEATPTLTDEQMQAQIDLLREQPRRIDGDPYALGSVDAPVVMIEFADYQCGYCQQFGLEVKPQLQSMIDDGTLRIEWRDFPIFGTESSMIAVAGRAAAQQGMFWEYNLAAMAARQGNQTPVTEESLIAIAAEVGIPDIEQFTTDLASPELAAEVQAEYDAALALLGQPSTPQFIINDIYIGGSGPAEAFIGVIEEELAKVS